MPSGIVMADPLYGVAPLNPNDNPSATENGNVTPPPPGSPNAPTGPPMPSPVMPQGTQTNPSTPTNGQPGLNQPENSGTPPTFMNGSLPGTQGPMIQNGISPGSNAAPMMDMFQQSGYPALAAPLAAAVYQPFGLNMYQLNPFQVTPMGFFSLTGSAAYATNIDYSSSNPKPGVFYTLSPALGYSTFDQYGFLSAIAEASLYEYTSGNVPSYLDEIGSLSAGTYLGSRVFVGVRDMVVRGSDILQSGGTPLGFLNGINPYIYNIAEAEVGIALTPKITFIQSANDFYYDASSFGAGNSNIQTLGETLNYLAPRYFLTGTYSYSRGNFSIYPDFISNSASGLATHSLSKTTQIGLGGSYAAYNYTGGSSLSFTKGSWYGQFSHQFNSSLSASLQGGWNFTQFGNGQLFQDPLVDLNIEYLLGSASFGINAGEYMINEMNYGVELGPADVLSAMTYFTYKLSPKVHMVVSGGITDYSFFKPGDFSNNFFSTLKSNTGYSAQYISQQDGIFYRVRKWLLTGLMYQLIDFSTNIPQETVIDNEFIATVSFQYRF